MTSYVLISAVKRISDSFIIYFVVILVSVKVDKIPYTLQFCDTAGQVKFAFQNYLFVYKSRISFS